MVGGFPYPQMWPICGGQIWSDLDVPPGRKGWEEYDALGRYFRHMNENHPVYEKWRKRINHRYLLAILVPTLGIVTLAFAFYYSQIVSIDSARSVGLLAIPSIFAGWFIVWAFEARGTRRFHKAWKEEQSGRSETVILQSDSKIR